MPNFALIKPEGGRRRSINDYIQENNQQRSADMQMQNQQMQLDESVQRQTDRAALRDIVQRSGGNWDQAANEAAAAGVSPDAVMALQDRAQKGEDRTYTLEERKRAEADRGRKESVDKLAVAGKLDEMLGQVGDQESYDRYRTGAAEIAKQYGLQFDVPETYDPAYVESKRKTAQALTRVWKTLSPQEEEQMGLDPSGTYQVSKSGEMKTIVKPKSEQKTLEQWGAMSPQEAEAAGFPAGSVIQRSNRGKLSAAYTPKGGGSDSGEKPTNARKQYDEMIALGVPDEAARATAYGTYRQVTDMLGNMTLVDTASGRVVGHMEDKGDGTKWVPEQAQPAGLPQSAAAQLQEGQVMTFGNGQQWTLQGGKPVRVK